jgi:DNA polymerase III delta prime subunit
MLQQAGIVKKMYSNFFREKENSRVCVFDEKNNQKFLFLFFYIEMAGPELWVEKYRPFHLEDVLGQDHVTDFLKSFLTVKTQEELNRIPHLLFVGRSGNGKTSTAKAFYQSLKELHLVSTLLLQNASDDRKIENIRNVITEFSTTEALLFSSSSKAKEAENIFDKSKITRKRKVVIMDEVDAMTPQAQAALKCILEETSRNGMLFMLIANQIDKIDPAIQSRCSKWFFKPLSAGMIEERLRQICEKEQLLFQKESLSLISEFSHGDGREAIHVMFAIYAVHKNDNDNDNDNKDALSSSEVYEWYHIVPKNEFLSFFRDTILDSKRVFADIVHLTEKFFASHKWYYRLTNFIDDMMRNISDVALLADKKKDSVEVEESLITILAESEKRIHTVNRDSPIQLTSLLSKLRMIFVSKK